MAQGERTMEFGVDDVDKDEKQESDEQTQTADETPIPDNRTAGVVLPGPEAFSEKRRDGLQSKLDSLLRDIDTDLEVVDSGKVLRELESQGGAACSRDPICLAGVGENAQVAQIVIVRAEGFGKPDWRLTVDRFDVKQRLFTDYDERQNLSDWSAVKKQLPVSVRTVFGLQPIERKQIETKPPEDTNIQRILAWTTGGLALAALGGGIYYGLEVKRQQDRLNEQKSDGVYNFSQQSANRRLRAMENNAETANVFYGVSAGLALTSSILFIVESGSDVAEEEQDRQRQANIEIVPSVGNNATGIGALITF